MNEKQITDSSNGSPEQQNGDSVEDPVKEIKLSLCFRDKRPPSELKFALEREVMVLFNAALEGEKLRMRAIATVIGAKYDFLLCFDAAFPHFNFYTLNVSVSWAEQSAVYFEYYQKTSASWFQLWTRDLEPADLPLSAESSKELYLQLSKQVFVDSEKLDSVHAIQQAIVDAMKQGAEFQNSHKEGGTNIYWKNGRFVRSDYGDYPNEQQYKSEQDFLAMLYQFCHWDVVRNSGLTSLPDKDMWQLIFRRMNVPEN